MDFVWLAGNYLELLWELWIKQRPERFVAIKFKHKSYFEDRGFDSDFEDEDDDDDEELDDIEGDTSLPRNRRASSLSVRARVEKVAGFLPDLQSILPDFKAIEMLRIPAPSMRGGYDFWDWGKVTYRARSFREGRDYLYDIVDYYQQATEIIERRVWFQVESTTVGKGVESFKFTGTPIIFDFSDDPLELKTFQDFVELTFDKGQGPFKLLGNPLRLQGNKVHVYGLDLHLWQRIYLELTPKRFLVVMPAGTCGNTVHRFVSNIQRFLSPDVRTYVGEDSYEEIMKRVLLRETVD